MTPATPLSAHEDPRFGMTVPGVFLNHASVAPPCRAARHAVHEAVEAIAREDPDVIRSRDTVDRARDAFASLISSRRQRVQCFQNTSAALSSVAWGLRWNPGDEVLVSPNEFVSNVLAWQLQAHRGVKVHALRTDRELVDPDSLSKQMGPRTRVVAVSAVHWATGARQDLTAIAKVVHDAGALLVVDAAQSLGAVQHTPADGYDVLATNTYKWLLSVNGTAFADFSPALLEQMDLASVGWLGVEGEPEPDRLDGATPAYRLGHGVEGLLGGAPSVLSNLAAIAAFREFEDLDLATVEARVREAARWVVQGARERGMDVVTPESHAGLVALEVPHAETVAQRLRGQGISVGSRGGWLRVAPHFYTSRDDITSLFEGIARHG